MLAFRARTLCHGTMQTKNGPQGTVFNRLIFFGKSGAGDGIRTHDPNLGKVVLYP